MDKFGIFELLDTLSEIASSVEEGGGDAAPAKKAPAPQPSPNDQAFLPPEFDNSASSAQLKRDALNALYERHDTISKRIDKKQ